MTSLPDLLFIALIAVVGPLIDWAVFWPAHRRLSQADPSWARRWLWASTTGHVWMLVGFGAAIWLASGRSWASFGFTVPDGWRLWTSIAIVLTAAAYYALAIASIARNAETRADVRQQLAPVSAVVPHTSSELYWFGTVSLTAGFCEEFLFRGYFIWVFAQWLGWWGAAALSLAVFAVAHIYQGWGGVARTGTVGAIFTLVVAMSNSLWPAIALHALVDLANGAMAWLALEGSAVDENSVELDAQEQP